jgi:serine/threonine protein kinase
MKEEFQKQSKNQDENDQMTVAKKSQVPKALSFINVLQRGLNPIASGSSGKVFEVVEKRNPSTGEKDSFVVKQIFFENDRETENGGKHQYLLYKEIDDAQKMSKLDPEFVFFPEFYAFYDATEEFKFEASKIPNAELKKKFYLNDDMDVALIIMEFLDMTLKEYYQSVLQKSVFSHFLTRLRIFSNICNGLSVILSEFSHCDLKPQNIMLKKISKQKSAELVPRKQNALRLWPDGFYQLKIIDFGLASVEEKDGRNCPGGSPQYQPFEFFQGNKSARKIDIYAVSLMMFDFELADLGVQGIATLLGYCNLALKKYLEEDGHQKFTQYLDSKKPIMQKEYFYELLQKIWSKELLLRPFMIYLEKHLESDQVEEIKASKNVESLQDCGYETLLYYNPYVMRSVFMAVLEFWLDVYYERSFVASKVKVLQENVEKYDALIKDDSEGPEKVQKAKEFKRYYEVRVALMNGFKETKMEMLNHLYEIILFDDFRPESETFFEYVNELLAQIETDFEEEYRFVYQMEEHYSILGFDRANFGEMSLEKYLEKPSQENPFSKMSPDFKLMI